MITVAISKAVLTGFGSDVHAGIHILGKLRAAGIPVVGTLTLLGVAEGVLKACLASDEDDVVFEWNGEEGLA